MTRSLLVLSLGAGMLGACANVERVPAPSFATPEFGPVTKPIETPGSRPAHDIPESDRIKWFEAQTPRSADVPEPERPAAERVVVREYEPRYRYDWYDPWAGWYLPVSLDLGWWWGGGHRHRGHGWGVSGHWGRGWWGW
jgi:hypothetical protein